MFSLERLRAFVVFSEHLNITHAARQLAVSQPALHAQISKLSDELGVPLYIRRGRTLELTQEGQRTAAFGREMLERGGRFVRELGGDAPHMPVVLAAGAGSYLHLLGPAIRSFVRADVSPIRLLTADRDTCIDAVQSGRAHLGVTAGELPSHELQARELTSVHQVLVTPRRHRLAGCKPRLADLEGESLVVPPAHTEHRRHLADAMRHAGVTLKVAVEASGWDLMMHFVSLGLGLAVVNGICRIPRGLVSSPIRELPTRRYWLLHRGLAADGAASQLARLIRDHTDSRSAAP